MSSQMPKIPVSNPQGGHLRLSNTNLDRLPDHIRRPGYDLKKIMRERLQRLNAMES